jgi:hypothetical protein
MTLPRALTASTVGPARTGDEVRAKITITAIKANPAPLNFLFITSSFWVEVVA